MRYLRIATHAAIFARPLSPQEAMDNVAGLLARPHARVLSEEDGFWEVYREVAGTVGPRGNLVPDAHLAALLRQHGIVTLYTHDRDFRRFDFLRTVDPLQVGTI
jgi:toxin-antitoxin system PIN domain toxin